jgi:hypothetical protein
MNSKSTTNNKTIPTTRSQSQTKPTKSIKKSSTITNKQKNKEPSFSKLSKTISGSEPKENKKVKKKSTDLTKSTKGPKKSLSSEIKITKNVDTIQRLITNSQDIMNEQNSMLENFQEMTKRITSTDYEIERLMNKNENDEFPVFLEKYGSKLSQIMNRLKNHTEEVEEIKCMTI